MNQKPHLITKETYPRFRALINEAKARKKRERAALLSLSNKLETVSPGPWILKLERQSVALHEAIMRELAPGTKGHWPARVQDLMKAQGTLIQHRRALVGDKEPFPVHDSLIVEPIERQGRNDKGSEIEPIETMPANKAVSGNDTRSEAPPAPAPAPEAEAEAEADILPI